MSEFIKEELGKIIKIKCPANLDGPTSKIFADQIQGLMLSPAQLFVLDLVNVVNIGREFYQTVIALKTNLKRDQKVIYSLHMAPALLKQVKMDGVELAFNPVASMTEILAHEKSLSPQAANLNVEFINPFLTAAQKTLEVQCQTQAKILAPFLKKEQTPNIAIAGVISLISNGFSGSIVLCFSQAVFLKIYENMFGEKHDSITTELEDAVGELLNIIYGVAKIELNNKGYNFQKALPTVMAGEALKIRQSGSMPTVVIPIETNVGLFHIEIEFNNTTEGKHVSSIN